MSRPEMGKLVVGQKVVVYLSANLNRHSSLQERTRPALITKLSRVWIDLESVERDRFRPGSPARTWRMRRDTQNEGNKNFPQQNAAFATLDQHAYDFRRDRAAEFLREQGIGLDRWGPWSNDDMKIKLADIIRAAVEAEVTE